MSDYGDEPPCGCVSVLVSEEGVPIVSCSGNAGHAGDHYFGSYSFGETPRYEWPNANP